MSEPSSHSDAFQRIRWEAFLTFAIALLITVPIVGFVLTYENGAIGIQFNIVVAMLLAAGTTLIRTLAALYVWKNAPLRNVFWQPLEKALSSLPKTNERTIPTVLLLAALLLPWLPLGSYSRYSISTATEILIYVMLGWGLNIVVGLAGLLDLGYVAFYAVGAYTYTLIATQFGWSFWVCLPLAGFFAALWGIALGFPVLRLRGDYLAIVTLAFGEIIRQVLINWQSLTGGPQGISAPRLDFFGIPFERSGELTFHNTFGLDYDVIHRVIFFYYVILGLALLTNFVTLRLRRLPIGRAWEALREDEIACRALGINTVLTKLSAFAIGAMFGGFAGSFFAAQQGFISPKSFEFQESVQILAIVVLGGRGNQLGVVLAAIVLAGSLELFRDFGAYRMLTIGIAMVFIMTWRPGGLLSQRTPSSIFKKRQPIAAGLVKEGHG